MTLRPARSACFEAPRDLLGSRQRIGSRSSKARRSVSKVVSAETLLVSRSGVTRPVVLPPGEPGQALRVAAQRLEEGSAAALAQMPIRVTPAFASRACAAAPMPGIMRDRLVGQERRAPPRGR